MNRNNFGRFIFVILIVAWSLYEIGILGPGSPGGQNLVQVFRDKAVNQDAQFLKIVQQAQALGKERPQRVYNDLKDAIGTNSIAQYFPFFGATNETHPTTYILNQLQREAEGRIKLGLDLQGGTSFLVELKTNALKNASETQTALSQAISVLRKRVDRFGVAEPVIQPEGSDRILIELPGLSQAEQETAKETIQKVAYLEFCLVHPDSDKLIAEGITPPGYHVLTHVRTLQNGQKEVERELVKRKPEMVGGIESAFVTRGNIGQPEIDFKLNSEAADTFGRITRENIGHKLAVILDGELQTAPVIRSEIDQNGQITGDYTEQEAFTLANVLENPLKTPVSIISQNDVDPTLGRDSIRSGIQASIYGIILVAAFMLVYYLLAGLVANVALMLNIIILLGVFCSIGATLTLPGIAGVVLTIGMAVDANVLI
ncbi:MAG TPA: protein translocase subunit SecD, partial [Verrucomicrobiae bacterium]|nr:protein translocase subunit SecD [Verrucomicrobiae bacterium]